jgi:DNA-binding transcriptional LysR family regulator
MDRFEAMRVFKAVAELESFSKASRALGLSRPLVTRAVAQLETQLGVSLLARTTRIVRLTPAGRRYLEDVARILLQVDESETQLKALSGALSGEVSVTASVLFGHLYVVPALVAFLVQHPLIRVRSVLHDRVVDLLRSELDIAVRIAHLKDSALSSARVGSVRAVLCAAPAYLEARGVPQVPEDLAKHEAVIFAGGPHAPHWTLHQAGQKRTLTLAARFVVSDAESAIYAAKRGLGITRVLSYQVQGEIERGELRLLLAGYEPPPIPVQVVHHGGRRATQRVRALVDFLVNHLRTALRFEPERSR